LIDEVAYEAAKSNSANDGVRNMPSKNNDQG
jgi:hypothetical protein